MTIRETLSAILRGDRHPALLHNCRFEGLGGAAYGEEAIVAAMRAAPLDVRDADIVACPGGVALFTGNADGTESAVFADLYDGHVARLWRLGAASVLQPEIAIGVPFDPDLRQSRGTAKFRAADHPWLDAAAAPHVETAAAALAVSAPDYRARVFVLRAFVDGGDVAALFAVHRMSGDDPRRIGFTAAAARLTIGDGRLAACRIVGDPAGEAAIAAAPWRPRA